MVDSYYQRLKEYSTANNNVQIIVKTTAGCKIKRCGIGVE